MLNTVLCHQQDHEQETPSTGFKYKICISILASITWPFPTLHNNILHHPTKAKTKVQHIWNIAPHQCVTNSIQCLLSWKLLIAY